MNGLDSQLPPAVTPGRIERRKQPRLRSLLGGRAYYGPGFTVNCSIRNLSAGGARVRTQDQGQALPDGFHLIMIKDGLAMRSETVWRRASETGVRFIEAVDLTQPSPQTRPMRDIWMQLTVR